MKRLRRVIVPNRADLLFAMLVLVLLSSIAVPILIRFCFVNEDYLYDALIDSVTAEWIWLKLADLGHPFLQFACLASGCLVGGYIAFSANLGQLYQTLPHRIVLAIATGISIGLFAWSANLNAVFHPSHPARAYRSDFFAYWGNHQWLIWSIGGVMAIAVTFPLAQLGWRLVSRQAKRLKINRTKCMIALAIVLGVSVLARDLWGPSNPFAQWILKLNSPAQNRVLPVLLGIGLLFGAIVPHLILRGNIRPWLRFGTATIYFGLLLTAMGGILTNQMEVKKFLPIGLMIVSASATILGINLAVPLLRPRSTTDDATDSRPPVARFAPSVWSIVISLALFAGLYTNDQYDIVAWAVDDTDQAADKAALMRKIKRELPAGSIVAMSDTQFNRGGIHIAAYLDESVTPDAFRSLKDLDLGITLEIHNNQPHVDLSDLVGIRELRIQGGELTTQQLADLLPANHKVQMMHLGAAIESRDKRSIEFGEPLLVSGDPQVWYAPNFILGDRLQTGSVGNLFNRHTVVSTKGAQRFWLGTCRPFSRQDFLALGAFTAKHTVTIHEINTVDDWRPATNTNNHFDHLDLRATASDSEALWFIFLETNAVCTIWSGNNFAFWDLTFGSGSFHLYTLRSNLSNLVHQPDAYQRLKKAQLLFPTGADVFKLDGLFLPGLEPVDLLKLPLAAHDIRLLSLDPTWLLLEQKNTTPWRSDSDTSGISSLEAFTQLEELYLPFGLQHGDLKSVQSLQQLKVLQIDAALLNRIRNPIDVSKLNKLERLILFNTPNPTVVQQLAKMPQLKQLTIVDLDFVFMTQNQTARTRLTAALPGVKITIIDPRAGRTVAFAQIGAGGVRPVPKNPATIQQLVPQSFKRHRKKVRGQLRKKYLAPAPNSK